jgi:hypothetical protein
MPEGDPIRIIPHRGVDENCGSFEMRFADGRPSRYFYWDELVSRRLRPELLTRDQAVEEATALARAEMEDSADTLRSNFIPLFHLELYVPSAVLFERRDS